MSIAEIFGSSLNKQQIIEQFRINHGLILTGESIRPSKQAIISENGELKMNVYEGQPIVYTYMYQFSNC
ncbi:1449_t:CDS:2 [Rhizophagus irregularis]|nr:1449_t:CDS:2 [Rhizophagus irregularis]